MGLFHRGKKNNDDEPDSVQTNSFSDIMNGLQYAVNCAQDTLQNHQIQNLTRLFEGTNANTQIGVLVNQLYFSSTNSVAAI